MRNDITDKFVEAETSGSKMKRFRNKRNVKRDASFGIKKESINRAHKVAYPDNDYDKGRNFQVMRRFLRSRLGKPWNDVYSEICQNADCRSYNGYELRNWLDYLVDQNCKMIDGVVYDDRGEVAIENHWRTFYVHPETGILEESQGSRRWRPQAPKQTIYELDEQLYHKHFGIWYRVTMKNVPVYRQGTEDWRRRYSWWSVRDAFVELHRDSDHQSTNIRMLEKKYGRGEDDKLRYCSKKESANSREIEHLKKKYNLG